MTDIIPFPTPRTAALESVFDADFGPPSGLCVIARVHKIPKSASAEVIRDIAFRDSTGEYGPLSQAAVFPEAPAELARDEEAVAVEALPVWLRAVCPVSTDLGALADVADECRKDEYGHPCLVETEHECPHCHAEFREEAHLPLPQPCPDCGTPAPVLASLYIGPEADLIARLCTSFTRQACPWAS